MVPVKIKRSGVHQYLPKQIYKWGFKNFVRTGASGIIYDFFIYKARKSAGWEKCGVSEVVLGLVEELSKNRNFQLFIDNCFSTLPFLSELKIIGILSISTFRSNRLGECPLIWFECPVVVRSTLGRTTILGHIFWPKCVDVGSSFADVECTNTVERYDLAQNKKVKVDCPDMVSQYNRSMIGFIWLIGWLPFTEPISSQEKDISSGI